MSKTKFINIKSGTEYLKDQIPVLPANCIFDKGRVGCGGTSIAIESDTPYVITVPYTALIKNKVDQYPHNNRFMGKVLGVMEGVTKADVLSYVERVKVPKFMVTYDSLGRLTEWIDPKDYKLLIDELHILFTSYNYRKEAIQTVFNNYKKYSEYCFMSASVLDDEFMLDELIGIPKVVANWEDKKIVTLYSVKCKNNVRYAVAHLINLFLNDEMDGNAYIFVNSVEFIKSIVAFCGLNDTNTRVVYSDNNKTKVGIKRGKPIDNPKKINLITSAAFEGVDFKDEDGKIFIVSDNSNPHTFVDISTSVVQIAGRIRDTKHWQHIYHIYTPSTSNSNVTYKTFKEKTDEIIRKTKLTLKDFDKVSDESKEVFKEGLRLAKNDMYIIEKDNKFIYNPNVQKMDLYTFKVTRFLYGSMFTLQKEYQKYGFTVLSGTFEAPELKAIAEADIVETMSFKDACQQIEYYTVESPNNIIRNLLIKDASTKTPLIREYIDALDYEGLRKRDYNKKKIHNDYIAQLKIDNRKKIYMRLRNDLDLTLGNIIPKSVVKNTLQAIYDEFNIGGTATGKELENYCDIESTSRKVKTVNDDGTETTVTISYFKIGPHKTIGELETF